MASRAFVSSTFEDLHDHRAFVIEALRKAGVQVDAMEVWASASDEPRALFKQRIEGADLCVLLVGLRRGHVPRGETRSIAQLEYDYAREKGLDILVFMLSEEAPWPRKYDELDADPGVRTWRDELTERHAVSFFDLRPESVEIDPALAGRLAKTSGARSVPKTAPSYVERIHLTGYRCFESETLELVVPRTAGASVGNVTVLLGNNGSGKSTVLSGLAVAILGHVLPSSGWVPRGQVRRSGSSWSPNAELVATLRSDVFEDGSEGASQVRLGTTLVRTDEGREKVESAQVPEPFQAVLNREHSTDLFLVGYGTRRRSESGSDYDPKRRGQDYFERFQRVGGLFLDDFSLVPLSSWLPDVTERRLREVREILQSLLGPDLIITGKVEHGDLVVRDQGVILPASALSDGYRSFVAWTGDLLYRLHRAAPDRELTKIPGIVLVDEIDLHLHPEWQRRVIRNLADTFPILQFVLTTHSPLIVGSLESENLRVCVREGDLSHIQPATESPYGLSGDQVLRSPYFGLREVRDADFEKRLKKLRKKAITGDAEAADELTRLLTLGAKGAS